MNIYTHYSESHKELYEDYFKPSLRRLYTKAEVTIRVVKHKQTTANGVFMEQGWLEGMKYKLQVILQAIEENWDDYFIFSDTDVIFYRPFVDDMLHEIQSDNYDIVCQNDCGSLCAGFFIAKGSDSVKNLFTLIYNNFVRLVNDQVALNHYRGTVKYKLLDANKYYTIGNFFNNVDGTHIWDGKSIIIPPVDMKIHHANYSVGVSDKIRLINLIKTKHESLVR